MNQITKELRIQKFWILPTGRVQRLDSWHADWIIQNPGIVKRYGVKVDGLHPRDDEQEVRLRAIRGGFVRMRYTPNHGVLVAEAHVKRFTMEIRTAIRRFVKANAAYIDNFDIRLLDDKGMPIHHGRALLLRYDERDRANHLPLVGCAALKKKAARDERSRVCRRRMQ